MSNYIICSKCKLRYNNTEYNAANCDTSFIYNTHYKKWLFTPGFRSKFDTLNMVIEYPFNIFEDLSIKQNYEICDVCVQKYLDNGEAIYLEKPLDKNILNCQLNDTWVNIYPKLEKEFIYYND